MLALRCFKQNCFVTSDMISKTHIPRNLVYMRKSKACVFKMLTTFACFFLYLHFPYLTSVGPWSNWPRRSLPYLVMASFVGMCLWRWCRLWGQWYIWLGGNFELHVRLCSFQPYQRIAFLGLEYLFTQRRMLFQASVLLFGKFCYGDFQKCPFTPSIIMIMCKKRHHLQHQSFRFLPSGVLPGGSRFFSEVNKDWRTQSSKPPN